MKHARKLVSRLLPEYVYAVFDHLRAHGALRFFVAPKTFNELVRRRMLWDRNPALKLTADKITAREYVRSRMGEEHLIPLYLVTDDPRSIDFDQLPQSFALKASHGWNFNIIVFDKHSLNRDDAIRRLVQWQAQDYYFGVREWPYRKLKPRILAEQLVLSNGKIPPEYKLFVFNGRVRFIQVEIDRFGTYRKASFDENWRRLAIEYVAPNASEPVKRPDCLSDLIRIAERLGKEFEFARIDLYLCDGRIYFGELTHFPNAGRIPFRPRDFDRMLGEVWLSGVPIAERFYAQDALSGTERVASLDSAIHRPYSSPLGQKSRRDR